MSRSPTTSTTAHDEDRREDDIRFALTAEAGLNDGLAFPFVHLALLLLAGGFTVVDVGVWVGWYVVGKIALGVGRRPRRGLAAGPAGLPLPQRPLPPGRHR